jgi:predicted DCC family thiol-disulfide oxidoreductase YuxK
MSGTLFFDGACGMCTRTRDLLVNVNRTGNLQSEPLQSLGAAERLNTPPARLLESVRWLDSSGATYSGAEAANAALSSAIGTKLPLMIYLIPGIRFVEDAVYRWIADHCYRFPGTAPPTGAMMFELTSAWSRPTCRAFREGDVGAVRGCAVKDDEAIHFLARVANHQAAPQLSVSIPDGSRIGGNSEPNQGL